MWYCEDCVFVSEHGMINFPMRTVLGEEYILRLQGMLKGRRGRGFGGLSRACRTTVFEYWVEYRGTKGTKTWRHVPRHQIESLKR